MNELANRVPLTMELDNARRLWAVDAIEQYALGVLEVLWPTERRVHDALRTARRFAAGEATAEDLAAAADEVWGVYMWGCVYAPRYAGEPAHLIDAVHACLCATQNVLFGPPPAWAMDDPKVVNQYDRAVKHAAAAARHLQWHDAALGEDPRSARETADWRAKSVEADIMSRRP